MVYSLLCNPYRYEVAPRDDGEESGSGDEEEEEVRPIEFTWILISYNVVFINIIKHLISYCLAWTGRIFFTCKAREDAAQGNPDVQICTQEI